MQQSQIKIFPVAPGWSEIELEKAINRWALITKVRITGLTECLWGMAVTYETTSESQVETPLITTEGSMGNIHPGGLTFESLQKNVQTLHDAMDEGKFPPMPAHKSLHLKLFVNGQEHFNIRHTEDSLKAENLLAVALEIEEQRMMKGVGEDGRSAVDVPSPTGKKYFIAAVLPTGLHAELENFIKYCQVYGSALPLKITEVNTPK